MPPDLARGFYPAPVPPALPEPSGEPTTIIVVTADEAPGQGTLSPSGALHMPTEDGGVVIELNPRDPQAEAASRHDDNLAEKLGEDALNHLAADLLMGIDADDRSRTEWLETRAKGIDMLGFKIEEPRAVAGGEAGSAPIEGMATVRHPLLPEAVIRFQSSAAAELLPTQGPVKVRNDEVPVPRAAVQPGGMGGAGPGAGIGDNGGPPLDDPLTPDRVEGLTKDEIAEALEKDFNHYLTQVDRGYRPDTDRMLFWVGFGGVGFKKVYHDPLKRMPLIRSIDATDLIVDHSAVDIDDAGRVTHRIPLRRSQLIRMQMAGTYRRLPNLTMTTPVESPNPVDTKEAQVQGIAPTAYRPEDRLFTVFECYTELDLAGFEHKENGEPSGLPLPYRVSVEKESRQILEIRRNWREDDPLFLPKKVFVKYPFVPAFGFYEIGLLHILGNTDKALTAAWRLMLDSGMFSNFPGFLYGDMAGRQQTNDFRVGPGQGARIQTGGADIRAAVMPLPYKPIDAGFVQLAQQMNEGGQRLGGTADMPVGEGKQDAPVGTTLALIEQATKMLAAVHIRLHAAQAEEFQLLKERFREDPDAFFRSQRRNAKRWEREEFLAALEDSDIVPAADPNTPSHMHRVMKAVAVKQLQAMNPQLYDARAVDEMILRSIGVMDPSALFVPPAPPVPGGGAPPAPPLDPNTVVAVQAEKEKTQADAQAKAAEIAAGERQDQRAAALAAHKTQADTSESAADRHSKERIAAIQSVVGLAEKGLVRPADALRAIAGFQAARGQTAGFADGGMVDDDRPFDVAMYAGPSSATANLQAMSDAESAPDPEQARRDTGWFQGPDRQWRYEIDDSKAALKPNLGQAKTLGDALYHPELYKAYPDLAETPFSVEPMSDDFYGGAVDGRMRVNSLYVNKNKAELLDTLLHETQHLIQDKEGFGQGTSPQAEYVRPFIDAKNRLAEAQARRDALFNGTTDADGVRVPGLLDEAYNRIANDRAYDFLSDDKKKLIAASDADNLLRSRHPDVYQQLRAAELAFRNVQFPSPETAVDRYDRNLGEVEARDVGKRRKLPPPKRQQTPPYSAEGYKPGDLIVRKDKPSEFID